VSLDPITITGGIGVPFIMSSLLVAKEANTRASKTETEMADLVDTKDKLIDEEIVKVAKAVTIRARKPDEGLSAEEYDSFMLATEARTNLRDLKELVSIIRDRTTKSYIYCFASAFSLLATTLIYTFRQQNQYFLPFSYMASVVCILIGYYYIRDGIYMFVPIRKLERAIASLKIVRSVEKLNEETIMILDELRAIF